ncbi:MULTISPECIES: deaminase domain-containing protein [unclassified Pseudomonas]|uniref:deaminase domain-containing protein n=1 Tax=unclassified Pseudomonas TaxID=196821 RepID=UPI002AC9590E|nr:MULTISPECIES: deaminase domain-containing protein [unclassified Pseudomonas]MEB0093653.1 deaminase domain-containing protein [Pseudomonas sp. CCI4.2]MEB0130613.1 deaminase domain-containing protein [Pseudomonas sp. CCI2.4]WPX54594.1 deaminase domain-containing protein [Pseudomonas sp. CCI4.2]
MNQPLDEQPFELKIINGKIGFAHWGRHELADFDTLLGMLGSQRNQNKPNFDFPLLTLAQRTAPDTQSLPVEHVSPAQLLSRYRLELPSNLSDIDACIETLNLAKEALLRTIINESVTIEELLDSNGLTIIKKTTQAFKASNTESILDQLIFPELVQLAVADIRLRPMATLATLLESATAQDLGQHLLKAIDWYGADAQEKTSPIVLAKLILKAIALELDPDSNLKGFDVDQTANWGKSYAAICADIERHFTYSGMVFSPAAAQFATVILAPNYPAGLKVDGVPAQLAYRRSTAWLQLQHGIHLAEILSPGASHRMSYQQLLTYPMNLITDAPEETMALISSTLTPPLLDWAQANRLIGSKPKDGYTADDLDKAFAAFSKHERNLKEAIEQLKKAPPDRLVMTQQALDQRGIPANTLFLDRSGYSNEYIRANARSFAYNHPLVVMQGYKAFDLLATGRLKGGQSTWMPALVRGHDGNYYPNFLNISSLPDIPSMFAAAFDTWWDDTALAVRSLVNALLDDLAQDERLAIEQGQVRLHTLRSGNLDLYSASHNTPHNKDLLNTPSDTHPTVARFGFLLHSIHRGNHYYHEIFPYSGFIRRRDDLVQHRTALESRSTAMLPFDWTAYSTGTAPDLQAKSRVIVHHLNTYGPPQAPFEHLISFPRRKQIINDIARQIALRNRQQLFEMKRGSTAFDKPNAVVEFLKNYIIPVWGPLEDLIEAAQSPRGQLKALLATLSLTLDILSIVFPVAKVAGLSTRFVKTTATFGLRAGLPRLGTLAKGMAVAAHQTLNPAAGITGVLMFVGKIPLRLNRAGLNLIETGIVQVRKLLDLASSRRAALLSLSSRQATAWTQKTANYRMNTVDEWSNVVVFEDDFRSLTRPGRYLVDPETHRPYGSALMQLNDAGDLSRKAPYEIEISHQNGNWAVLDDTPDLSKTWVRWGDELTLDAGGISYKLVPKGEGSVLRRSESFDAGDRLKSTTVATCRLPRGLDLKHCSANTFRNVNHSGLQARTNLGRNVQPWFTDISITASQNTGEFVHNRFIWRSQNSNYLKAIKHKLGPDQYKVSILAEVTGGNDIFKRIAVKGGIVGTINDTREISAVVAVRRGNGLKVIVTRVDDQAYYKAIFTDGQKNITFERMQVNLKSAPTTQLSDNDYLAHIYNGSFDANAFIKTLSPDVINADLKTIKAEIDAGRTPYINRYIGGPYDMGTTAEEAALFCKYTRSHFEIVPRKTSPYWKAISKDTPLAARTEIANQLNRLHLSPRKFTADNILMPHTTRLMSQNNKNLAYMKVSFKDPKAHADKVFYAISGLKKTDTDVELTKFIDGERSAEAGWTIRDGIAHSSDNVSYINSQRTRMATGAQRDPDEVIFLPDLKSHSELLPSGNHRMLDTEHMILNRFYKEQIDFKDVGSIHVFSTKPTCPSCTMGLAGLRAHLPEGKFEVFEGIN